MTKDKDQKACLLYECHPGPDPLRKQYSDKTQHTVTHVNNRTLELIRTIRAYNWMDVFKNGLEPLQSFIGVVSQQSSALAVDVMARSRV